MSVVRTVTERRSAPAIDGRTGTTISSKYVVLGVLGRGGMGTVYDCENVAIGRRVAVKVLSSSCARYEDDVGRFQREARAAARIGHPNIVDVLDMGRTDDGLPYIVMERLEGKDLCALIRREKTLPPTVAADILSQVLAAIGAAHSAGIIHRDLKPENVFLARRGPRTDFVKVLDFGVAKFHVWDAEPEKRLTQEGVLVGTPAYMSPEQILSRHEIDARSDLYSAGVILYEMLTGQPPYEGETVPEILIAVASTGPRPIRNVAPDVPEQMAAVVGRAMARDPAQRFQTAVEFTAALEPFLDKVGLEILDASRWISGTDVPAPAGIGSSLTAATTGVFTPAPGEPRPEALLAASSASRRGRTAWALAVLLAGAALATSLAVLWLRETPRPASRRRSGPIVTETEAATPMISLDVTCNVAGAQVSLDGTPLGVTPLHALVPRRAGEHVLKVQAAGYEPTERTIPLGAPVQLVADLSNGSSPPAAQTEPRAAESNPPPRPRRRVPRSPREGDRTGLIYDDDVYDR